MTKEIEEGADHHEIAKNAIPLLVNIDNNIERLKKADHLAIATSLPREFVHRELLRLLDSAEMKANEARQQVVSHTIKALGQNPLAFEAIMAGAQVKLDKIAGAVVGYNPVNNANSARNVFEKVEAKMATSELITGFKLWDQLMGGVPKEGVMMSMPGKPSHGKSIDIDNFIVGMLNNNPDLQIILHHVDDAAIMRIPRILGVMSGLSSRDIANAGASMLDKPAEFEEKYRKAREKFLRWIDEERLILADQSVLVGDLTAHERWIKEIRRRNLGGEFVSIGDNFHLFDMPGMDPGEGKVRDMSKFIAALPTKHGITTMFTMELPKESLKPGNRPKDTDSKGSGNIAFDSKVNMNIYQELQDLGGDAALTWQSPDHLQKVVSPDRNEVVSERTMPIVELIVDKNKFSGEIKTLFYRLEPMSGRMEECSPAEQSRLLKASKPQEGKGSVTTTK